MSLWVYPVVEVTIPEPIQQAAMRDHHVRVMVNGRCLLEDEYAISGGKLALNVPVALRTSDYLDLMVEDLGLCWEMFRCEWSDRSDTAFGHVKLQGQLWKRSDDDRPRSSPRPDTHLTRE